MSKRSSTQTIYLISLIFLIELHTVLSLRCRTEDGISESELKRVTRSCMHKMGETTIYGNNNLRAHNTAQTASHFGHKPNRQKQQQQQQQQQQNFAYDSMEDYENGNYGYSSYQRHDDIMSQRNRERLQTTHTTSGTNSGNSKNEHRYHNERGNTNHNNHNGNNNNANNNGNAKQRGQTHGNANHNYNTDYNETNSGHSNSSYDSACVTHCFFEELNMLSKDDFPDRHKVTFMLTKDLRDRELRNFYAETIQECFHYLETQRKKDKCNYSRELINCMSEYAKANCDDWDEFSVIFN